MALNGSFSAQPSKHPEVYRRSDPKGGRTYEMAVSASELPQDASERIRQGEAKAAPREGGKLGAQFGAHLDQNWSQLVAEQGSAPLPASPYK
jgi:hypothetical protein